VTTAATASSTDTATDRRATRRADASISGHLTWRDARGATRFASVVTRDISDFGAYVECESPASIPLFRLVTLQLDDEQASSCPDVPQELRAGKVQCAVYRAVTADRGRGARQGYGLRLLIDPRHRVAASPRRHAHLHPIRSIA
jgi:hypothetical protein